MDSRYDVIVLGSGLGGLGAAFECSRKGLKTLLLEQHNLPGGYATSFVRGRFEFEPSLHELPDMRSIKAATGVIRYLLDDAQLDVGFSSIPDAYRLILTEKGTDVRMPFGVDNLVETISREVPGSEESVRNYMNLCREVQDAFKYLNEHADNLNYREVLKKHGNFVRTGAATAAQVADSLNVPKAARDLLLPYWCYLGVPENRVSFSIWSSLLDAYISSGAVIPKYRSHELSSAFIDKFIRQGGEFRLNTRVTRILARQGRITGVELAGGEQLSTPIVISNTSPTNVFSKLIFPPEEVPSAAYQNIRSRKLGFSLFVVYLGLDRSPEELGLEDYSYFIAPHMDTEKLYPEGKSLDAKDIMQASVCLNIGNPGCSPPGTTILALTAGQKAEAWADVTPETYNDRKEMVADIMIEQFEKAVGVDLRSHIEEIEIAAPQTFARYTDSHDGIVYGYEPEVWDGIVPRVLHQKDENYLKGLHFCGGFSFRCHGYGSSIMSGKAAAEAAFAEAAAVSAKGDGNES
ncbi:MAG: NAD(P)/FAD-dependent oxidoreductase [Spirochaetales bacterium]|nr:NAD(P)/FAD-dependent oxidoreductase [Spirochaetales bacterium]